MARIQLSEADVRRITAKIAGASRQLSPRLLTQEVNRTAAQVRTDATRRVKADLPKLPVGTIRRRFEVQRARNVEGGPAADVRIEKRPINLARFGARQTKRGGIRAVSTVKGETVGPFRHAFIITARFGDGEGRTTKLAVQRLGKGAPRLPVKGLFGPTVLGTFEPHLEVVLRDAGERLLVNVSKRIDSELGRGR